MQDEFNGDDDSESQEQKDAPGALYNIAMGAMKHYIDIYLDLTQHTNGLTAIEAHHIQTLDQKMVILSGIASPLDPTVVSAEQVVQEWERMRAVPFTIELAITKGVYIQLRDRTEKLLDQLEQDTAGFITFDAAYISTNPYMLPILQRLAGISSKSQLKERIGHVSDNAISASAAEKLAQILNLLGPGRSLGRPQILQSVEPTLEGIVRDLVGRVLLESIVANALDDAHVQYMRESEYRHIKGILYDFRADFIIPDDTNPVAFIEVRKSSTRHASLYAKDKMFSAINWKGNNKRLLAIIVVDGPWTAETLRVMAKVYDYVVPLNNVADVARIVYDYVQGDQSRLKWLIDFAVHPAS